jgi:hypothetical protein
MTINNPILDYIANLDSFECALKELTPNMLPALAPRSTSMSHAEIGRDFIDTEWDDIPDENRTAMLDTWHAILTTLLVQRRSDAEYGRIYGVTVRPIDFRTAAGRHRAAAAPYRRRYDGAATNGPSPIPDPRIHLYRHRPDPNPRRTL